MSDATTDPFGERVTTRARTELNVLGADVIVESTDNALLDLAIEAFGDLPRHRLGGRSCRLRARLVLSDHEAAWRRHSAPPRAVLSAGNGLLCATIDAGNFAVVDPSNSSTLVCVCREMLRRSYYARYELIELALLTLASRRQSLVPLHAACIGIDGAGLLLMGASGSGKSTLGLQALVDGMQLLSEDSAFVAGARLLITGTPNFLHVDRSATSFLESDELRQRVRCSPEIRRRSGKRKFEVDLRAIQLPTVSAPLQLTGIVFLTGRRAGPQAALSPLGHRVLVGKLRREQPYAQNMPTWQDFERHIAGIPAYELRRTKHPAVSIQALRALLD